MDLISVVVAVYNAEKTLEKCVDSLLKQTYKNTEIILVNDCSKDNSLAICENYAKNNSNIVVIDNPKNMKVSATRNNGIKASKGKYICFVDSDDYVDENYLQKLYVLRQEYEVMPICGFIFYDQVEKRSPVNYIWSGGSGIVSLKEAFRMFDEQYLTALWNKLLDNDKIKENGILFDENLPMGEDLRFSVEYLKAIKADKVYILSEPLYHYLKINENSLMSNYGLSGFESAVENTNLIKSLCVGLNKDAELLFAEHIEKVKRNFVYHISRNKKLSDKEKIEKIQSFMPNFTKKDLRKEKMIIFKEKLLFLIFRR